MTVYYPADGTTEVPLNARVRAFIAIPGDDAPVEIQLQRGGLAVAGRLAFDLELGEVQFVSALPLDPAAGYTANVAFATGRVDTVYFETAALPPPALEFDGLTSIEAHFYKDRPPCTDRGPAIVARVRFEPARAISPANAEYFLTQEGVAAPRARLRGSDLPAGAEGIGLVDVPIRDVSFGPSCFAVHVRDLTGVFDPNASRVCVNVDHGPNFRAACSAVAAGAPGRRSPRGWGGEMALFLFGATAFSFWFSRRSRRRA